MAGILHLSSLIIQPRTTLQKATKRATMATSALSSPMPLIGAFDTKIPKLVYGTAWKKDRTADLVYQALKAGFKGVDTAAQPRHYQERLVGDGIRRAIKDGIIERKDLYIQTKYTPRGGQDPQNMPYDGSLSIADQVHASVAVSLNNLNTGGDSYLDCLMLHTSLPKIGGTAIAWNTLSSYVAAGKIRHLGIANVSFPVLTFLVNDMEVKPSVVQNRFYADTRYEVELRRFCREQGIVFQSFWTLTGNPGLMKSEPVADLVRETRVSREVALYALVMGLEKVTVLDGTTNEGRMVEDIEGLEMIGEWAENRGKGEWQRILEAFKELIGEV